MPEPAVVAAAIRTMPYWVFLLGAAALLVLGFLLRHHLMARRFKRMNAAGVQVFRSYWHMYTTRIFEQLAFVCSQMFMLVAGLFVVLAVAAGVNG